MTQLAHRLRVARFRSRILRSPLVRWKHHGLNAQDVFVASYPRSGITWLRFMLFEVATKNDAVFSAVPKVVPYIGRHPRASDSLGGGGRLIFTHEPFSAGHRKTVYVVRDARAVAASEYRWQRRKQTGPHDMDEFLALFLSGRSNPWGSWDDHVRRWLGSPAALEGRLHLVKYEELRSDAPGTLKGVADFLGLPAADEVIQKAVANNSIDRMRAKEDSGLPPRRTSLAEIRFVGTGEVSGWRNDLTPEQAELIELRFQESLSLLDYL